MKISHKKMELSDLIKIREKIHLNPAWQRGPVWPTSKQALLIDSILRGYDIPMIYLRECAPNTPYKYEVVDGQQRLRSLWNFIDGVYTIPNDFEKVNREDIGGKGYNDLPKVMQYKITKFIVIVAIVKNSREPEISRLFSRMQMGVRLNPAELRNAVQTGLRHAIDGVARLHKFFSNSRIPAARFKHQDYLAHAFSICLHNAKRHLKAPQLMDDYNHVTDSNVYGPIIADADSILTFLDRVNTQASKRITQKWIFVDLFYLLYQNKLKLSKLNIENFSHAYVDFDKLRLKYNAEPDKLLIDEPTKAQQDLYDYILAFKISGGEQKNLYQRNQILQRNFKAVLEV